MDTRSTRQQRAPASKAGPAGQADVRYVEIDDERAGQRLDNFVTGLCKGVPKSHVYRLIRSGQLREAKNSTPASAKAPTVCPLGNELAAPRA